MKNAPVHPMKWPVILKDFSAVLPPFHRPQEEGFEWLMEAHARAAATHEGREDSLARWRDRISRLVSRYNCPAEHIGRRRSNLEDFMHTEWQRMKIFNLLESPEGRGLGARNRFYAETTTRVVEELFAEDTDPPSDLLHVSCTGYVSPSPIQRLINLKRWHDRTLATQIYHMGCYAAVPALRVAAGLLQCAPRNVMRRAEIVHTELCTLHFNPLDHSPEQLIVQSLFADGHIRYAMVPNDAPQAVGGKGALELLSVREEIVPDSLDAMTWVLSDWGFSMTLSRDVPGKIATALPGFLTNLFAAAGRDYDECAAQTIFAVHPGGPRIIDSVAELLGLREDQLAQSRGVLFERGNMSSATLPHIWMAAATDASLKAGSAVASLAFGPGLTIAGALFQKC
jgi:predicted naringenin-chalcone synthase